MGQVVLRLQMEQGSMLCKPADLEIPALFYPLRAFNLDISESSGRQFIICKGGMGYFPGTVVPKHCSLGGSDNRNSLPLFCRLEVKSHGVGRACLPGGAAGGRDPGSLQRLVVAGHPRSAARSISASICTELSSPYVSACVSLPLFS